MITDWQQKAFQNAIDIFNWYCCSRPYIASTYKLNSKWNLTFTQNLRTYSQLDIIGESSRMMARALAIHIDQQILEKFK